MTGECEALVQINKEPSGRKEGRRMDIKEVLLSSVTYVNCLFFGLLGLNNVSVEALKLTSAAFC